MRSLLEKLRLHEQGELSGATVYSDEPQGAPSLALRDDILVAAQSDEGTPAASDLASENPALTAALEGAEEGSGLGQDEFDEALAGLPEDALLRAYGDLSGLSELPDLAPLRELPWIDALRTAGAAVSFEEDAVSVEAALKTDSNGLTGEDLPFPADAPTPELVRQDSEIAGASANQSQTTVFLLRAVEASYPDSDFVADVERLERALEIDFEADVLEQFDGPSASSLTPNGEFAARSEVEDPEELLVLMRRLAPDLGRLVQDLQALRSQGLAALFLVAPDAPVAPRVLGTSRIEVSPIKGSDGLYEISNLAPPSGLLLPTAVPDRIVFGLVDDVFVVASDEDRARAIAAARSEPPPEGVEGASVAAGDLSTMRQELAGLLGFDPGPLGELTASVSASTSELRASARVEFGE